MDALSTQEQQWLQQMRQVRDRLYVGMDHHAGQVTVAMADGQAILDHTGSRESFHWVETKVFDQDGGGYRALLDHLAERYPQVPRDHYLFLSEPSYAKPCSQFLRNAGFSAQQVLWVDPRKVAQYRRSHHLVLAGKNDADDARTLLAMLFRATSIRRAPSSSSRSQPWT